MFLHINYLGDSSKQTDNVCKTNPYFTDECGNANMSNRNSKFN